MNCPSVSTDQADSRRPGSVRSVGRMFRSVSYPKTSPRAQGHSDARATSVGASPRPPERTSRTIPMTLASRSAASAASTARVSASAARLGRVTKSPAVVARAAAKARRAELRARAPPRRARRPSKRKTSSLAWRPPSSGTRTVPSTGPSPFPPRRAETPTRNIRRPPPPTGRFSSPRARPRPRSVRPPADPGARFLPCQVPRSGTLQA